MIKRLQKSHSCEVELVLHPFDEEQEKLKEVFPKIERQLSELEKIPRYYGDDFVEQVLDAERQKAIQRLRIAEREPYFGRLDFQAEDTDRAVPIYIGKAGVADPDGGEPLIIDWRAPIASMFYSFTGQGDRASYVSPDGEVSGTVYLKRNIAIRNQRLQRVVDSYVRGGDNAGIVDEFLLYRLSERKDHRLRDIVSTIQQEQDQIIRAERNKALIIQGVPGSGKTTVALHRLAYLLYHYQNMRAERIMIFAPNRMFLDYISDVLPELGVGEVKQSTFADWALEMLDEDLALREQEERWEQWFSGESADLSPKRKGSLEFYQFIQSALEEYEAEFVPKKDFLAWEGKGIPAEEIERWFSVEYKHDPLLKRKERIASRLKRWIEMEHREIRAIDPRGEKKKQAMKRLQAYWRSWPKPSPLTLYQQILRSPLAEELGFAKLTIPKKKEIDPEDLPPLLLIHHRLNGIPTEKTFDHVVIDEAQDFSPFQVAIVKAFCPSQSFTILGDLLQTIFSYQGIEDWDEFQSVFPPESLEYYQLNKSYRSTMEIIQFANEIIKPYAGKVALAQPVYRSGEPVRVLHVNKEKQIRTIIEIVSSLQGKANTIALVTRTPQQARELYLKLKNKGIDLHLLTAKQAEYMGGISVMPIYLTKGMEFDAVLLLDVDAAHYPEQKLSAKLLFVGCTRALHHLYVLYSDSLSPLIRKESIQLHAGA